MLGPSPNTPDHDVARQPWIDKQAFSYAAFGTATIDVDSIRSWGILLYSHLHDVPRGQEASPWVWKGEFSFLGAYLCFCIHLRKVMTAEMTGSTWYFHDTSVVRVTGHRGSSLACWRLNQRHIEHKSSFSYSTSADWEKNFQGLQWPWSGRILPCLVKALQVHITQAQCCVLFTCY